MTSLEQRIAQALLTAPGWARVALTTRDEHLRDRAAQELAICVADQIERPFVAFDRDQMPLPL